MPPPTPSTAPARSTSGACPGGGGSKTDLKSIKQKHHIFDHFSIRFESHFGAISEPFLSHFRAILEPCWSHVGVILEPF